MSSNNADRALGWQMSDLQLVTLEMYTLPMKALTHSMLSKVVAVLFMRGFVQVGYS
jgi:hypothetical protein